MGAVAGKNYVNTRSLGARLVFVCSSNVWLKKISPRNKTKSPRNIKISPKNVIEKSKKFHREIQKFCLKIQKFHRKIKKFTGKYKKNSPSNAQKIIEKSMSATIWATLLTTLPTTKSTSMSTFMSATMSTFMCFFTGADRRPQRLKHRWERLPKHIELSEGLRMCFPVQPEAASHSCRCFFPHGGTRRF